MIAIVLPLGNFVNKIVVDPFLGRTALYLSDNVIKKVTSLTVKIISSYNFSR